MSMIKYCENTYYDRSGNPNVIDLSVPGFMKTASYDNFGEEIREYISSIKPKDGYAYLLIAAMGDQNWGPNRNGDYWPTEALKNPGLDYGHKTYEVNGNWYHHHQNKDPNLSYGRVLKSVWNDEMGRIELIVEVDLKKDDKTREALDNGDTIQTSMGCFVAGTPVLMADLVNRPIEEIKPGDEVIGHDGKKHVVNNINDYIYYGDICHIKPNANTEIVCTADHRFYTVRAGNIAKGAHPSHNIATWAKAKTLNPEDYLLLPIIGEHTTNDKGDHESWADDNYRYTKVKYIGITPNMEARVYNLDVEGSDSFIAGMVAVHNSKVHYDICKVCHPNWREFYKIPEDDMITISKESDLNKVHEIGRKYGVDLSYITKMNPDGGPVGIHSNTTKYCDHMRYSRNQILPTGEQVCVINLRPSFFDISYVSVNADKSSFVLAKVAEARRQYANENIDDEAEKLADQVHSPGDGIIDKEVPDGEVIADNFEDIKRYYLDNICPELYIHEAELPDELIDDLACKHDLASIMSSFMGMGMFPHPREFQRIVMIQLGKDKELNRADIMGDYLSHSDIPEIDPDAPYNGDDLIGIDPDKVDLDIMEALKDYFWERSGYRQPVIKRMFIVKKAAEPNRYLMPVDNHRRQRAIAPALLASLGSLYAVNALEGKKKFPDVLKDAKSLKSNKTLAISLGSAIAASILLNKMFLPKKYDPLFDAPYTEKKAASTPVTVAKWVGPTLGSFLWGGHVINKAQQGRPVTKIEKFVAQHPVPTSIASTVLVNKPKIVPAAFKGLDSFRKYLIKGAEHGVDISMLNIDEYPLEQRDAMGIALWQHLNGIR